MRVLEFIVTGQDLRKSPECDFSEIVAGSVGYLKATFKFSDEWDGCVKTVSFWFCDEEYQVNLDESSECVIPSAVLIGEKFSVSVTGERIGYTITSDKTKVRQTLVKKSDCGGDSSSGSPNPSDPSAPTEPSNPSTSYEIGHGLKVKNNKLMVDSVSDFNGDNTLPATASLIQSTVGNIELLLNTI